jgi:2-desacetyl-2-hydroxyethyl bacteriochlorophyllide A dehydrogenase
VKAAVISGINEISIEKFEDPVPGPREVIIKVASVGICGTDLHILEGEFAPTLPIIPGHEMSGEIIALGSNVTELKIGDMVAIDPSLHCGECFYCKRARGNLCENWGALGVSEAGAAAEFLRAPIKNCYKLPENVAVKDASLIEPLSCAVRGFDVLPRIPGSDYLIYGSGTMGLMMMEMAKRNGAASVSIVDPNKEKLKTAEILGVDNYAISADELEKPRGWDVVIDCTGVVPAIRDGLTRLMPGGTFLQFGVANESAKIEIEPFWIYNKEINIVGSMAVLHSFGRAVELFAAGVIDPQVFISHRYGLDDYKAGLEIFKSGGSRKVTIEPQNS